MVGLPSVNLMHPEDLGLLMELRKKYGNKKPIDFLLRALRKNGEYYWTKNTIFPYPESCKTLVMTERIKTHTPIPEKYTRIDTIINKMSL